MPATFIVVPEWQASASSRAMRLAEGAGAIAEDLPSRSTTRIAVPTSAGESQNSGIARFTSLKSVAALTNEALAEIAPADPIIGIGGDRGIAPLFARHSAVRAGQNIALLAFDAESCDEVPRPGAPAIALEQCAYAAAFGRTDSSLDADPAATEGIVGGERSTSSVEQNLVRRAPTPDSFREALAGARSQACHIHVDLSVLDPGDLASLLDASPFGWSVPELTSAIADAARTMPVMGASISGFAPASEADATNDLGSILRIVGALTRVVGDAEARKS